MNNKTATPEKVWALLEENAKGLAETRRLIDGLGKKVGGIENSMGDHAEQFFQDSLAETLTFGGEKYDSMLPNLKYIGKGNAEFDIVLVNGKNIAIIEAKNKIRLDDLKELVEEKTAALRKFFPEYANGRRLYLGIAGFSFTDTVRARAKKLGIGIIKQVGKSIEIEDNKLKAY